MLKAKKSFAKSLTIGKTYPIVNENKNSVIIVDDQGFYVGFNKSHFEIVDDSQNTDLPDPKYSAESFIDLFSPFSNDPINCARALVAEMLKLLGMTENALIDNDNFNNLSFSQQENWIKLRQIKEQLNNMQG